MKLRGFSPMQPICEVCDEPLTNEDDGQRVAGAHCKDSGSP